MQRFLKKKLGELRDGKRDGKAKRQRLDSTKTLVRLGFHSLPGTVHQYIVRFMDVGTIVVCRRISTAWNAMVGSTRDMHWMREIDLSVLDACDHKRSPYAWNQDDYAHMMAAMQWITTKWPLGRIYDFTPSPAVYDLSRWVVIALARAHQHVPREASPPLQWTVTSSDQRALSLLQDYHRAHPTGMIHIKFRHEHVVQPGHHDHQDMHQDMAYEVCQLLLRNPKWILLDGHPLLECGRFAQCKKRVMYTAPRCPGCNRPCCGDCTARCQFVGISAIDGGESMEHHVRWMCRDCISIVPGCRQCSSILACPNCVESHARCAFCNVAVCGAECARVQYMFRREHALEIKMGVIGRRTCDTCWLTMRDSADVKAAHERKEKDKEKATQERMFMYFAVACMVLYLLMVWWDPSMVRHRRTSPFFNRQPHLPPS